MTTQYERERDAAYREDKRLLALLDAALLALATAPADTAIVLADAIAPYHSTMLRESVERYERDQAERAAALAGEAARVATYDALPDAPPDTQCAREVGRTWGRMTEFGRCLKAATKVVEGKDRWDVTQPVKSYPVCKMHAREVLRNAGRPGLGRRSRSTSRGCA